MNNGRTFKVEVTPAQDKPKVRVEGVEVPCDWMRLPDGHHSLIVKGRVYDFILELSDETGLVVGRDGTQVLHIRDARRPTSGKTMESGQSGLQRIKADMPGKVVRILVAEGETVTCDQGLIVLEAMKMQNEIRAPKSGVVREIGVAAGKAVNTGEFLLSLE